MANGPFPVDFKTLITLSAKVPYDRPTLSISTSVSLWYIHWSRWSSGLGVYLARRRSWDRFPRRQIPRFFLSGYLLCGSRLMLSKFNCSTLGRKTVPFILTNSYTIITYVSKQTDGIKNVLFLGFSV